MQTQSPIANPLSIAAVTVLGLACLVAAMGIGRFAFTPLFPLMQQQDGLTLAQGAWLATANYLGYLVGALASYALMPSARNALRWGLLVVALTTTAMALGRHDLAWIALRFLAGAASAFVLVGTSAWALGALAAAGRADLAGWVFSGVGFGIVLAGVVALAVASAGLRPAAAWLVLGVMAFAVTVAAWRVQDSSVQAASASNAQPTLSLHEWALVLAYGGFGFGYIIPATFLPALARALAANPLVFGWAWPFFGAAAAASTVLVTRRLRLIAPRTVCIWSLLVMAAGVLVPAVSASFAAIGLSALCVGGTFMVMTMAGFQEGRRIAQGPPARLIAAMTAAFALGQLLGPLLVGWGSARGNAVVGNAILFPSLVATAVLLACALVLAVGPGAAASRAR